MALQSRGSLCGFLQPKWSLIWLLAALALQYQSAAQSASVQAALTPQDLFSRVSPLVYIVEDLDDAGNVTATASAVGVEQDELLTNKHAVVDGISLRIRQGATVWSAKVEKLDEAADFCLLRVPDLNKIVPAKMRGSESFRVGERVYAIGSPLGLELSLSDGLIAGLRSEGEVRLVQTTAPISPGSSGGGLFDAEGNLIGITTFHLVGGQNLNFAIAAERLVALRQQSDEGSARAWAAVAAEIADNALSVAGIEPPPSDLNLTNSWAERMRPRLEVVNRERQRAARAYNESLRLNSADATVWVKLGSLYASLEQPGQMKNAFDQALRLRPGDISIWTALSESYAALGRQDHALEALREAVRLDPRNVDVWISLAVALCRTDSKEAERALHQAEQLRPQAIDWERIGMAYQELKRYANAEAAFREAVQLEPKNALLWALLGNFYGMRHDKRNLRKVSETLRGIDPSSADKLDSTWQ